MAIKPRDWSTAKLTKMPEQANYVYPLGGMQVGVIIISYISTNRN